ncbi:MAG: DegT/DnrJ/EryC1/StrS family aminotransferase [Lachnospiraceae bacterium]|nr:DegT/DnrJ/EryC1/StrS family aminotransferase [Lachnospiraceae bacterium]
MKIMPNRMDRGFFEYQEEFEKKALEVLRSGWYILGKEVEAFEKEFAAYVGAQHCIGLASGLDALSLAFRALNIGPGDEVIVQANTYIASVMGITMNGATPVFVEPDEYYGPDPDAVEAAITPKTKAVLVVHLYGQSCRMDRIVSIAKKHGLKLVEDCAQSHGATFEGKMTGSFGDIGCFSFYPSKNLGAFGDAGAIVTDDEAIDARIRMLRNYGSRKRYYNEEVGVNSRLDELQAGLLRVRLSHLKEMTREKQLLADTYDSNLMPAGGSFEIPKRLEGANHVFHQYVIRCKDKETRERLIEYLSERGIGTIIHYPIPPHLSEAYAYLGFEKGSFPVTESYADTVLSIPMYNGMTQPEQAAVIGALNSFS